MKAYELLSDKTKWTQGFYARSNRGTPTPYNDDDAHCFCTLGAIFKCYPHGEDAEPQKKLRLVIGTDLSIPKWNDAPERTYEEVIEALKKADI